jgi:hypothetical protein
MAAIIEAETQWHAGEEEMHKLLRVPHQDNPTSPFLSPFGATVLRQSPLLALGALDSEGKPWTTLWGGETGFSRPIAQSAIGIQSTIDRNYDPVAEILFGNADGQLIQEKGKRKMVGGLAIDLEHRKRVKLYGRMLAGALNPTEDGVGDAQLAVMIEQSLGKSSCDFHLNPEPNFS